MKLLPSIFITIVLMMISIVHCYAQNGDEIFSDPLISDPFSNSTDKTDNKKNYDDEIIYDTLYNNTPTFFQYLTPRSGPIRQASLGSDPGDNPDAPFDDYLVYLIGITFIYYYRRELYQCYNQYKA